MEQFGEARLGAGMLRAGDGVAGHKMHPLRNERLYVFDDLLFDRADIGDDGALAQTRRDTHRDFAIRRERRREHDKVGAVRGGGGIVGRLVGEVEAPNRVERLGAARAGDDARLGHVAADDPRQRGADQADADQRDALKQFIAHRAAMNSVKAAATPSISSPVPIVMRRHSGRP